MPTPPITHFVFVDLENVPGVDVSAAAGHPVHVTLLIGKHQKSFSLEQLRAAQTMGDRLDLVEVGASGHNALDITLAYYLGRAVENAPDAEFAIVSKDKDFDPMIAHLRAMGISAARHTGFASLPFLAPARRPTPKPPFAAVPPTPLPRTPKPPAAPARTPAPKAETTKLAIPTQSKRNDVWDKIVIHLANPNHPRPGTRKRLLGFLKDRLGKASTDAEAQSLMDRLQNQNHLSISSANKVSYR